MPENVHHFRRRFRSKVHCKRASEKAISLNVTNQVKVIVIHFLWFHNRLVQMTQTNGDKAREALSTAVPNKFYQAVRLHTKQ